MAVIAVRFYANPGFQLSLTILVLFSSYVLQVRNRPYMSELEKRLQVTFHEHAVSEGDKKHIEIESIISRVKKQAMARLKNRRKSIQQHSFGGEDPRRSNMNQDTGSSAREYFFDYNTVELVLLGSAIVICAAGIMFTSGQFENRPDLRGLQDTIGTIVIIVVVLSLLYYLLVIAVELSSAGGQKSCVNSIVSKLGSRDKNAEIAKKIDLEGGEVEMAVNPMNQVESAVDRRELERLKVEAKQTQDDNQKLMAALRHQKNKGGEVAGRKKVKSKRTLKNNKKKTRRKKIAMKSISCASKPRKTCGSTRRKIRSSRRITKS